MRDYLFVLLLFSTFVGMSQDVNYKKLGIESESIENLKPLKVGDKAPDFEFEVDGKNTRLSEYVKEKPLVMVFYRGHWCPICNKYLSEFQEELHLLEMKGYQAIAVAPQKEAYIDKTIEKTDLTIPVVSDKGGEIMKEYGVSFSVTKKYQRKIKLFLFSDIAKTNGKEEAELPVPATYVIGKDMKIQFVHFDPDYKNRASVTDILAGLEAQYSNI